MAGRPLLQTPFNRPADGPGAMATGELATLRKDIEDSKGPPLLRSDLDGIRPGVETLQQGSLAHPSRPC